MIEAKGEFCFAALNVRNVGDVAASLDPACQYMLDGDQRFEPHPEVMALDELSVGGFGREIAPGQLVENTALYYDVPKASHPEALELHEVCGDQGTRLALQADLRSDRLGGNQG